jgi:Type II/IV secretion system protein
MSGRFHMWGRFHRSGGTRAAKTTLLAALFALVSRHERIVIVEDSRELTPNHPHVVRIEGRPANAELAGAISLTALVRQSVRIRRHAAHTGDRALLERGQPLTREQILDELDVLATVEHAIIVEYLSVQCALGHDLPAEQGGATTEALHNLATDVGILAASQMRHFKNVNRALVESGRSVQVGRADSMDGSALGPPSAAQLERLVEREERIARAIDERYKRLRPAVESGTPVLEGQLFDDVRFILDTCTNHAGSVAGMRTVLDGLASAGLSACDPPRDDRTVRAKPPVGR